MEKRKIRNKILIVIGSSLIIVAILSTYLFFHNKKIDKLKTETIINNLFSDVPTPDVETQEEISIIEETPKQEIILTNNYLGYIEFTDYGIKRLITTGTSNNILDQSLVGTLSISANLDDEFGNIILAGHNTSNVFQKLHYMKIGDQVKIVTHKNAYYYTITNKYTVNDNDMSYFKRINDKKQLTLITCNNDGKKRLIVICELRG